MTGQSAPQPHTFALECTTLAIHLLESASRLAVKAPLQYVELTQAKVISIVPPYLCSHVSG